MDGLGYWTIYWEDDNGRVDVEAANKAGLIAFSYDGSDYLALGGCGMDLSPMLDAYIAFTHDAIPKNSLFFSDRRYFEQVVGREKTKEIEDLVRLYKPEIHMIIT